MRAVGLPTRLYYISRNSPPELSPKAAAKLHSLRLGLTLRQQGLSSTEASEALGIPRANLYRWLRQLDQKVPRSLEDKTRRPHRTREVTYSLELVQPVLQFRQKCPRWGKDNLAVLLEKKWKVCTSTV